MVRTDLVDAEEVRQVLRQAIIEAGGQTSLATEIGCSKQAISRMLSGNVPPWPIIYEYLGFEFVPMFRRVR